MNIHQLFADFYGELVKRTNLLTEDNIRYYWFAQMLNQDKFLDHYTLEKPYSDGLTGNTAMKGKMLDLCYEDGNGGNHFVEIKYHRKGDSTLTLTENAGKIINDMYRLNTISKKGHRLFLFVTDDCMENYLCLNTRTSNSGNLPFRHHLKEILTLPLGQSITVSFKGMPDTPATFVKRANLQTNLGIQFNVKMLEHRDIKTNSNLDIHIRLYEIL